MMRKLVNATLRLSRPFGFTLLLTLVMLVLLIALLEGLARLPWVETHVPTAIGSAHPGLDVKFGEVDYLVSQKGRIDCIFLGSSVVQAGIDPQRFEEAYRSQTGDDITCYNFGIPGLKVSSAVELAAMLIDRYHPRLLIVGLTVRELALGVPEAGQRPIDHTPWIRYESGTFNVEGWIVEHFVVYRHFLALREWTSPDFDNPIGDLNAPIHRGYQPRTDYVETFAPQSYLKDYSLSSKEWAAFERLIALEDKTQLLLVEVPLPDHTLAVFKGGPENYRRIMNRLADYASAHGVPMWFTIQLDLIPDNGWVGDSHHLHQIGAEIFSAWLGARLGQAANQGQLMP